MFQKNSPQNENLVSKFIRDKIKATGPITVADYMQMCTTAPESGYYTSEREIFGAKGDFITSPEISQIFGELIAVWIMNEVTLMGFKGNFQLIELGPGSGTLAADILRVFSKFNFNQKISLHLVEISQHLAETQENTLCSKLSQSEEASTSSLHFKKNISKFDCPVFWYKKFNDVPKDFCVILAHELFDALPVHCFRRNDKGFTDTRNMGFKRHRRMLSFQCNLFGQSNCTEYIVPRIVHM